MTIAQVIFPVPLSTSFDYRIVPHQSLYKGVRVKVPFGKRQAIGIVIDIVESSSHPENKLKEITEVLDQEALFTPDLWQILWWATDYYHYPIGEVFFHALPARLRDGHPALKQSLAMWEITSLGQTIDLQSLQRAPKQHQLMVALNKHPLLCSDITIEGFSESACQTLAKKGLIGKVAHIPVTESWQSQYAPIMPPFELNAEQQLAISMITEKAGFNVWLLQGVTGSGKTEVYIQTLQHALTQGKQALILVPEISLTPQTINRFKERFNVPIDVLHSGLNDSERLSVWLRCKAGENALVIGTRSALFTPFKQLGIIIIDEEHDSSYKQQDGFRYNARDLAILRSHKLNIPIILGSATPAIESLYNVQQNKYTQLFLNERAGQAQNVKQHLIDLKGVPLTFGLSSVLIQKMKSHLDEGNQVMIFLNRRGFSPILMCHDCGWIAECPRCDHYYTVHQQIKSLKCHHCDSQRPIPKQCIKCGSTHLISVGVGTEQLELSLPAIFPDTPITRIDRDTTSKKGALEKLLNEIAQSGSRLLIGTQILAKGHHFPFVTLVALIDVDGALFSTDFRSSERFAQLYIQVSGRAGRGDKRGEVFLQTHHPDHPLLRTLLYQGYNQFSQKQIADREIALLPPFTFQALLRCNAHQLKDVQQFLMAVKSFLQEQFSTDENLWVLGPAPSIQAKRAGRYRWQLLVQHNQRKKLHQVLYTLTQKIPQLQESRKVRWSIDVDPTEA